MLQNVSYISLVPKSGYKVSDCKLCLPDELLAVGDVRTSGNPVKDSTRGEYLKLQAFAVQWNYVPEPTDQKPHLVTESNFVFANEWLMMTF